MNNKQVRFLTGMIFCLVLACRIGAAPENLPDVMTVKKLVRNMQDTFARVKTYKCGFKITVEKNKSKETQNGTVKYKSPDRIIFLFDEPKDQIIYCDSSVLKVYLPDLRVVGEQKLESPNQDLMFINSRNSFYQLTKQYNFYFPENYFKTMDGEKIYILHLTQKNVYSGFKNIDLWVSTHWYILRAIGTTREGRKITISFHDIQINENMTDNEFDFDLPVDIQTIYNPFYSKQEKK
jgi:outer membrane lipoprotein-sorting protein